MAVIWLTPLDAPIALIALIALRVQVLRMQLIAVKVLLFLTTGIAMTVAIQLIETVELGRAIVSAIMVGLVDWGDCIDSITFGAFL